MTDELVSVRNLSTYFHTEEGTVRAVDGVNFDIQPGETLGVVGESGCGKSVTALSLMRLVPDPGEIMSGSEVYFEGGNLGELNSEEMRRIRGNEISMIFQEPMTSLNPVYTVGDQIAEAIELHEGLPRDEAWDKVVGMLERVGISSPKQRAGEYPHQMSGGMRQRVMIAMALACNPKLLIADEPTTALDVTIQAQILELMRELQDDLGMAIMLITHDLGVIADMADRVTVMYSGKVVEEGDVYRVFEEPMHPYTQGLMASIPQVVGKQDRLHAIEGTVPDPLSKPVGCSFHPRCPEAMAVCRGEEPELLPTDDGRAVSCWLHHEPEDHDESGVA